MTKKEITQNCSVSGRDQQLAYFEWMKKMQSWSIIDTETKQKVCKGELFVKFYFTDREVLRLFTVPVTEDGDILVSGYRLQKREVPDQKKSEDEVIDELSGEIIRKTAVKFLFDQKLNIKDDVIMFTYDKLVELMSKFGKREVFDRHREINEAVDQTFVSV